MRFYHSFFFYGQIAPSALNHSAQCFPILASTQFASLNDAGGFQPYFTEITLPILLSSINGILLETVKRRQVGLYFNFGQVSGEFHGAIHEKCSLSLAYRLMKSWLPLRAKRMFTYLAHLENHQLSQLYLSYCYFRKPVN